MQQKAAGHRQFMDIWPVQIARVAGAKPATCDAGNLTNCPPFWPLLCVGRSWGGRKNFQHAG